MTSRIFEENQTENAFKIKSSNFQLYKLFFNTTHNVIRHTFEMNDVSQLNK